MTTVPFNLPVETCEGDPVDAWAQGHPTAPVVPVAFPDPPEPKD